MSPVGRGRRRAVFQTKWERSRIAVAWQRVRAQVAAVRRSVHCLALVFASPAFTGVCLW